MVGTGAFGKVYKSYRKKDKKSLVAIKVLDKHKLGDQIDQIVDEVEILNKLDHPNIVKYFETYDDNKFLYLVMEYIDGCELFDMITKNVSTKFTEREA